MEERSYAIKLVTTTADLDELASLPGKYLSPTGSLLLARSAVTRETLGCVGIRPMMSKGVCEMKRPYVAPQGLWMGLGSPLIGATVKEEVGVGYKWLRPDALPTMAVAYLYRQYGFVQVDAYYTTPIEGTMSFERMLAS